jgi:signal transduction histidine kinase
MTALPGDSLPAENNKENGSKDIETLKKSFSSWNKQQLLDYAASTTHALIEEQQAVKKLTTGYNTAQNWALGLALVEEIGQNLASTLDLTEVLTRLLRRVYNAIDVEDGSILLIEEPSGDLVSQVVLGTVSETFRVPKGHGIAGAVAETGAPMIVNNAQDDSRHFKKIDQKTGFITKSILCVPLLNHQKIIGVLEVFNKKSGPFTLEDQLLLGSIANYAGIAIENARLHQSVVEERDRVIRAQEEVSHKLQRDLHDGPTQLVAAIQMSIDFCHKALQHNQPNMVKEELANMQQLADRATHQLRTLLFELRPLVLETKGLIAALETFINRRQQEAEQTTLHLLLASDRPGNFMNRLEAKSEAALFAIAQEAVNNALKHAKANNIYVKLNQAGDNLTVTIADDGRGFDVSKVTKNYEERGSYGMVNLRERVAIANGDYSLDSKIGEGTELTIKVPLVSRAE